MFAVKASQYLTHMKRLTDIEPGHRALLRRASSRWRARPSSGPVLWQLPERFTRDVPRLAGALDVLPDGRHAFEFRHPSWFEDDEVLELLRWHKVALAIGDHPRAPVAAVGDDHRLVVRALPLRRARPARQLQRDRAARARTARKGRSEPTRYVYFNNDWEGFAVKNALRLRALLS